MVLRGQGESLETSKRCESIATIAEDCYRLVTTIAMLFAIVEPLQMCHESTLVYALFGASGALWYFSKKTVYSLPVRDRSASDSTVRGRTMHCARAVRKVGYFRPVVPNGQGDCINYCVPMHKTAQILTQSHNSDHELNQPLFHTETARLLSASAVFALWTFVSPVVGGFQGGHGKADLLLGALPMLCARCAETPPMILVTICVRHTALRFSPEVSCSFGTLDQKAKRTIANGSLGTHLSRWEGLRGAVSVHRSQCLQGRPPHPRSPTLQLTRGAIALGIQHTCALPNTMEPLLTKPPVRKMTDEGSAYHPLGT